MARMEVGQLSFNGGELAPALHGRSDIDKYGTGVALAENIVMRPHGGAYKRVGTHCIAEALETNKPTRLIPFRFSVVQSYMLEFGDYRMRIIKDDAPVAYPPGHAKAGQTVVIATPYAAEDLERLNAAQTSDLMVLTHYKYRMRKLKRLDHHDWVFEDFNFGTIGIASPAGLKLTKDGKNGAAYCVSALKTASVESLASDVVTCTVATGIGIAEPEYDTLTIEQCRDLWITQYRQTWPAEWDVWKCTTSGAVTGFLERPLGYYGFYVSIDSHNSYYVGYRPDGTRVKKNVNDYGPWFAEAIWALNQNYGNVLATMRDRIRDYVTGINDDAYASGISTLTWNAVTGAQDYYIYRAASTAGPYYFLKSVKTTSYTDDNGVADSSRGPVKANNPFAGANANPGVGIFFEQRLVLARSDEKPCTFWGSRIGVFDDFSTHSPLQDDDSYEFTMDSGQMNEILWALPLNEILFGTSGGEWKAGGGGQAITPKNVNSRPQSMYGCAATQPVIVGRSAVFVGRSRQILRDLAYSMEADAFDGDDLTLYATHLFENRFIVQHCYQQEPNSTLWVVMTDGTLLSCVYLPKQRVVCWSRHRTQGMFEGCASLVNMDGTDRVYFTVTRQINGRMVRFIEVMHDRLIPLDDIKSAFYVDCGLTYEGTATAALSGLNHLENCDVDVVADGNMLRTTVRNGRIELKYPARKVHVGLRYDATLETLDMQPMQQPVKARPHSIAKVEVEVEKTAGCRVGPLDRQGDQLIQAVRDGAARLFTGRMEFFPEPSREHNGFRLRFVSDQPYPMCLLAINAVGDVGGQ